MKAAGDGAQCVTGGNTSGNLFTLAEAQYSRCTTALRGRNTPGGLQDAVQVRGPLA